MRILHVFDHSVPLHSGYTFRSLAILREQRARGWETFHLTGPKQGSAGAGLDEAEGFEFYRTGPVPGPVRNVPLMKDQALISVLTRRLAGAAREVKPDILHAHSPVHNARAALAAGRRLGIPVVYEVRAFWEDAAASHGTFRDGGFRYTLGRALETRAFRAADAIVTICEGLRGDIAARGIGADKIAVVPNAVDLDLFKSGLEPDPSLVEELGLAGKKVLGFIGSFYGYEGLDLLVDAMPAIRARHEDAVLLLVGGGPQDRALRQQVSGLGLDDAVLFTGRVPHDQVQRYYALVDAFIYPRRDMRLTDLVTPLKPLEAMAQHKAVLASDIGGHRELIRHGETGILFPPDSSDAVADAVCGWLTHPQDADTLVAAAYRDVAEKRTWRRSVANYAPVYDRLAG